MFLCSRQHILLGDFPKLTAAAAGIVMTFVEWDKFSPNPAGKVAKKLRSSYLMVVHRQISKPFKLIVHRQSHLLKTKDRVLNKDDLAI